MTDYKRVVKVTPSLRLVPIWDWFFFYHQYLNDSLALRRVVQTIFGSSVSRRKHEKPENAAVENPLSFNETTTGSGKKKSKNVHQKCNRLSARFQRCGQGCDYCYRRWIDRSASGSRWKHSVETYRRTAKTIEPYGRVTRLYRVGTAAALLLPRSPENVLRFAFCV